jgi:ribosomal protein S12 methylthiotransferase
VIDERWEAFMALQTELAHARGLEKIGATMPVIIDDHDAEEGHYVARTKGDAPEIDGVAFVRSERPLAPGDIVDVLVDDADGHELYAHVIEN